MAETEFESILVVFQNHKEGRREAYDDWYTNIHIRDAMRLDGAIATQRFIANEDQLVLGGKPVKPGHWAHTIYEWESAKASVDGHSARAGTPLMEITSDGVFPGLRDYFFRPVFLSHGWSREGGFRKGARHILTAMIVPRAGDEAGFADWFRSVHAPATLALPGFATASLFSLHEEQSLPVPCRFPLVAIYGLADAPAALAAWSARQEAGGADDLAARSAEAEVTCWKQRIDRLMAASVANPNPEGAANELRAREAYKHLYMTQAELGAQLASI